MRLRLLSWTNVRTTSGAVLRCVRADGAESKPANEKDKCNKIKIKDAPRQHKHPKLYIM